MKSLICHLVHYEETQSRIYDSFMLRFAECVQAYFGALYQIRGERRTQVLLAFLHCLVDCAPVTQQFIPAKDTFQFEKKNILASISSLLFACEGEEYAAFKLKLIEAFIAFEVELHRFLRDIPERDVIFYNTDTESVMPRFPLMKPMSFQECWFPVSADEKEMLAFTPGQEQARIQLRLKMYALQMQAALANMEECERQIEAFARMRTGRCWIFVASCLGRADPREDARRLQSDWRERGVVQMRTLRQACSFFNQLLLSEKCVVTGRKVPLELPPERQGEMTPTSAFKRVFSAEVHQLFFAEDHAILEME